MWFYVHPTLHTLSLIYLLITELTASEDPSLSDQSSSASTSDAEEEARNAALGLGSAQLKAVLSELNTDLGGGGVVKGGEVLAIIHDRMQNMSGDPAAHALYRTLSRSAGVPYVSMLEVWTTTGRLVDPYEEMCVKESKFIDRGTLEMDYTDEYWERRYTVSFVVGRDGWQRTYDTLERYSFGTGQHSRGRRRGIRLVCQHRGQAAGDSLVVHVSRHY